MNEFTLLRARAKERRDQAISLARSDYEQAMAAIGELENRLLDRGKPKVKRVSDCVREVMPTDRAFTSEDILEALQAFDPTRVWNRWPVTNAICAMRKRGVIYRVRKCKMGQRAMYAAKGVKAPTAK